MAVSAKGRAEKASALPARLRQPDLSSFYGRDAGSVSPGGFDFRLTLMRGAGVAALEITTVVESFSWEDSEAVLTGALALRRPVPDDAGSLPIGVGHRVALDVAWKGGWYRLWEMRVQPPETTLPYATLSVELRDDLTLLSRNRRDWSFRKTKARKRGFFPEEIVREVARTEGLRVGVLAKGKYRIDRLVKKNAPALDIIRQAYGHEREKSGRRFVIRMRAGKLEVIGLQRNQTLYVFKEQIEGAVLSQEQAIRPVTVLEGRGRIGRKNGSKKVRYTEQRRALINRYGRVVEKKDYGRVSSLGDLRSKVRRDYAKKTRVKRTATLTVPGVPFIRRGDGCQRVTREAGWYGSTNDLRDRSFIYVRSVSHEVGSDGYTTTMDVVQEDPYFKDSERQDKEARERARKAKAKAKAKA